MLKLLRYEGLENLAYLARSKHCRAARPAEIEEQNELASGLGKVAWPVSVFFRF